MEGQKNKEIVAKYGVRADTVRLWRNRRVKLQDIPLNDLSLEDRLQDAPRSGASAKITADQCCQIEGLRVNNQGTLNDRSRNGVHEKSPRRSSNARSLPAYRRVMQLGFYKEADLKPHLSRYWLTPAYEAGFDEKVADIYALFREAPERAKQGQHIESLDEMTGVQAVERKHPGLPMTPGKVEHGNIVLATPLIVFLRPGFSPAGLEQIAPQVLVYGWMLQFGYAMIPYLQRRALSPGQEAALGGSWFSLAAVHAGGIFLAAIILSSAYSAPLLGAAYLL